VSIFGIGFLLGYIKELKDFMITLQFDLFAVSSEPLAVTSVEARQSAVR